MSTVEKEYILQNTRGVVSFPSFYHTDGGPDANGKPRKNYHDKTFRPGMNKVTEFELACLQTNEHFNNYFEDQGQHTIVPVPMIDEETGKPVVDSLGKAVTNNIVKIIKKDAYQSHGFFRWVEGPDNHSSKPFHKVDTDEAVKRVSNTFEIPTLRKLLEVEERSQNRSSVIQKIKSQIDLLANPVKAEKEDRKKG